MAWCLPCDKPLSEPMMDNLLTHIWVTRPQWVNTVRQEQNGPQPADYIFYSIFLYANSIIFMQIFVEFVLISSFDNKPVLGLGVGWVGLWGFLWWAPSAKRKDHHQVISRWSSVWHCSNTGLSSTQYEQIPIILGVWPFWLTPFFFRSITFLAGLWLNCI